MCTIDDLRNAVINGITKSDAEEFMVGCDFKDLARVANELTRKITGDTVTVVNNVVINYSNICVAQCQYAPSIA